MFQIPVNSDLSIRLLMRKDAGRLFRLVDECRHDLRKWLPWVDSVQSEQDYHQLIPQWLAEFANETSLNAGVFEQDQLVGMVGFHSFDYLNRKTSIGYWLGIQYRGRGIMTQTVKKMLEIAFLEFQMNRVEIRCAVGNYASRAIPERLGFCQEGVLRAAEKIGDRYVDHVVYAQLKKDFA